MIAAIRVLFAYWHCSSSDFDACVSYWDDELLSFGGFLAVTALF